MLLPEWNGVIRSSLIVCALLCAPALSAHALDKQGSAHGGDLEGPSSGFELSGSLLLGSALYNPSYAARPDNTGLALLRYGAHIDIDLIGRRLSIPIDVNFFSDRERDGAAKIAPSEFDFITGLSSTWKLGPGALEVGSRIENDMPVDRGGSKQRYVDARARYLFSLGKVAPAIQSGLRGGDVGGWATLGWFAYNPTYFARPDNTGRALFRYALHGSVSMFDDLIGVGLDATFFTDRWADNVFRPSELDLTPEIVVHLGDFEAHLAYERDMPLDADTLTQHFVYFVASWSFVGYSSHGDRAAPPAPPTPVQSPDLSPERHNSGMVGE